MKNKKIAISLTAVIMGLCGNAMAAEETSAVQVNASILPSCKFVIPQEMGVVYNPKSIALVQSSLSVQCTKTTNYEIGLSRDVDDGAYNRLMRSGENSLSYIINAYVNDNIFEWDEIGSTYSIKGVGEGVSKSHILSLTVLNDQYVPAGTYTDELVVTFNY